MRHLRITALTLVAAVVTAGLVPTSAGAARSAQTAVTPKILRVTPMRLGVGELLTIRGRNFKAKARRNTVIFQGGSGRTAFAKPIRASKRKLVVRVPASVARLLVVRGGRQQPTRLRLRVLAGRFSGFTPRRLSPVVLGLGASGPGGDGPGGSSPPPPVCKDTSDHDGDLLPNALEIQLNTDPCQRDTDRDGLEDGYEVQSAIDLNHYPATPPLPYPGKRPYPNALDPSDPQIDYDGDGLRLREEFLLWLHYSADGVRRPGRPSGTFPLDPSIRMVYSDGLQKSVNPPPVPADAVQAWVLDIDSDGVLGDDERDADGDGIGNWDEVRGRFTEEWWPAIHNGIEEPAESQYPPQFGDFLDNEDLPNEDAHTTPDMDGDGILDGADDHDHDGLPNGFEIRRPDDWLAELSADPITNPWAYVQPFNPCKPVDSERCHEHPPVGYYDGDDVPPIGPPPPPGYPASRPATPDG